MTVPAQARLQVRPPFNSLCRALSLLVMIGGSLVLIGWFADIPALRTVIPGAGTVKCNAGFGFFMAGLALWLAGGPQPSEPARRVAALCAAIVTVIGLLTLAEYLFHTDLGLDQLLISEPLRPGRIGHPGRMAPATALSFLGAGSVLILLSLERAPWLMQGLTATTVMISLTGYLYGVTALFTVGPHSPLAPLTAIMFSLLCIALLCARPDSGLIRLIAGDNPGGALSRRLLPITLVVPILFGWLRLEGERLGLYDAALGTAIVMVFYMVIINAGVLGTSYVLSLRDRERKRLEEALSSREAYFRTLSENALDLVAVLNPDGTVRYASPSHYHVLGYTPQELISTSAFDLVHPDDLPQVVAAWESGLHTPGHTATLEYRFRHRDGSWRIFEAIGKNLIADPILSGLIVASRDITERKQAEEALQESEERYRRLTENAFDLIAEIRLDGQLVYVSPNHKEVLGYDPSELVGQSGFDLVHPDDLAGILAVSGQERALAVIRFRHRNGEWRWLEAAGKQFRIATGEQRGVIISRDITDRKRADEALAYQANLLANVNDAVIATDTSMTLTSWNHAAEAMYGWKAEEVLGRYSGTVLQTRFIGTDSPTAVRTLLETGQWSGEVIQCRRDGTSVYVEAKLIALRDETGTIIGGVSVNRDITERKQAEEALCESEERYRTLTENAYDLIAEVSLGGRLLYVSPNHTQVLGYETTELLGKRVLEFVHPDDLAGVAAAASEEFARTVFRFSGKDGTWRWFEGTGKLFRTAAGKQRGVIISRDITERKQAEEAVRESEQRFRAIADTAPVIIWMIDPSGACTYLNRRWLDLRARSLEEELGAGWQEALHPDDRQRYVDMGVTALSARQQFTADTRVRRADGEYRWLLTTGVPRFSADGSFLGVVGSAVDVTERKRAEQALRESTKRLQVLSRRLLEVQETERRTLARELHDEIGQSLTAVKISLQRKQRLPEAAALAPHLEDSIAVVERAIEQIRDLSLDLRPSLLDDLGLVPALRWYLDRQAQRAGLSVQLVAEPLQAAPPPEVQTACFRVVQDAITNVMQHAEARRVRVELRQQEAELHLVVRDDGIGFDVVAQRTRAGRGESMGLLSMEERAALVGGCLEIISAHASGTEVRASFPLHAGAPQCAPPNESEHV